MSDGKFIGDNKQLSNALKHMSEKASETITERAISAEAAARIEALEAQVKAMTEAIEACERAAIYARDTCGLDQDGCLYVSEETHLFGVNVANDIADAIAQIKGSE